MVKQSAQHTTADDSTIAERNFMFDKAWQFFSKPVSTIGILPQFGTNAVKNMFKIHQRSTFSSIGTLSRAFFVPSMTDLHCQSSIYHIEALSSLSSKKYLFGPFQKNIMSVHILSKSESFPESLGTSVRNVGQPHSSMIQVGTIDGYNCSDYSRSINRLLHGQSSRRVSEDSSVCSSKSWRHFQLSRSFSYSTAAAPDASFYGAPRCDQLVDLNNKQGGTGKKSIVGKRQEFMLSILVTVDSLLSEMEAPSFALLFNNTVLIAVNSFRWTEVFTFPVESGDVIVAGTDGLFDNLYNDEINAIVVLGTRIRLTPLITAQKIAALARQRALDKNRHTPFSGTAQDAGYRHYGGKLDYITVVYCHFMQIM
ncbi:putative protein phosphatase 2C 55 [Platanthera guangdongensis]|uniref:Protein phosphatase n=1 Tax=Platanthera guangdongensis TaxID=2320717 RepID=A0ABR2LPD2_9ASPA